ncbi:hypothetical protein OSTOST_20113 [Ostertagia ostertagi]
MVLYCLRHNECGAKLLVTSTDFRRLTCPLCHLGFEYSGWESECVPAPFVAQSSLGCAVVLKPTRGDFLHYNMGDDLHIGISNSVSVVHSYWVNGISSECVGWDKSIVVCRFSDDEDRFDFLLSSFLRETANNFEQEFYDDARWNCFDFVMEFLRFINFRRYTKIDFVSEFVQGALNSAIKYNTGIDFRYSVLCTNESERISENCIPVSDLTMAEMLEENSNVDADRVIDQQSFNCSQFEIFTHEYRERKEVPGCEDHGSGGSSCCGSPSSCGDNKKRIVNSTRKLQKAVLALQRMPNSEAISDMLQKMRDIGGRLNEELKQLQAEFSTKTVAFPVFDPADMHLLLGEDEVPKIRSSFEEVEESERAAQQRLENLLFEAEVMLREYEHLKQGIRV